jgi:hypothetical protein
MGAPWARHGMCELAFTVFLLSFDHFAVSVFVYWLLTQYVTEQVLN